MNKKRFSLLWQRSYAAIILIAVALFNAACAEQSGTGKADGLERRNKTEAPNEKFKLRGALTADIPLYDETVAYAGGDVVNFNGKLYRARWWSLGDLPSIDYVWEVVVDHPLGRQR